MSIDPVTILRWHSERYPLLTEQDQIKLLYQRSRGAGHMIPDRGVSLRYLEKEYAQLASEISAPLEPLGNDRYRLSLQEASRMGLSPDLLNRIFAAGAETGAEIRPEPDGTEELTTLLRNLPASGTLDSYIASGCPSIHHSAVYREAYHPAYRVIEGALLRAIPLILAIENAPKPVICAIDGKCGGGKTSLARMLASVFQACVIHMDDFYVPFRERTPERTSIPGWNVDIDRFRAEVLAPLARHQAFSYRHYDPRSDSFTAEIPVPASNVYLVEGSYSLRPDLTANWDLTCFVDLPDELQQERILLRNGPEILKMFNAQWIPNERNYHEAYDIPAKAGFLITNKEVLPD